MGTIGINMVPIEPHTEKDTTRETLRKTEITVIDIIGDEETDIILTIVEVGEDRGLLGVNTKVNTDKFSVRLQPWSLQVVF